MAMLLVAVVFMSAFAARPCHADQVDQALKEAHQAGLTQSDLDRMLALAYQNKLEPDSVSKLLGLMTRVKQANLPTQPFFSKIEEGLAKKVPPQRISAVMQNRLDDYEFTRALLERSGKGGYDSVRANDSTLVRIAESLNMGVSRDELSDLVAKLPGSSTGPLASAVETLAACRHSKVSPDLADQLVTEAVQRGYFNQENRGLGRVIAGAKRKGIAETEMARVVSRSIERNQSPSRIATELGLSSKDLDFGPQIGQVQARNAQRESQRHQYTTQNMGQSGSSSGQGQGGSQGGSGEGGSGGGSSGGGNDGGGSGGGSGSGGSGGGGNSGGGGSGGGNDGGGGNGGGGQGH